MHRLPVLSRLFSYRSTLDAAPEPAAFNTFYPTLLDVLKVRHILRWKVVPGGLPVEIIDLIVDDAEYWPSTETMLENEVAVRWDHDQEVARSVPLCYNMESLSATSPSRPLPHRTMHPCRKIVFNISSHDQGWGGQGPRGTYEASYSWFDTKVIHATQEEARPSALHTADSGTTGEPADNRAEHRPRPQPRHPMILPSPNKLQANPVATSSTQRFTITWHYLDNIPPDSAEAADIEKTQGRGRATLDGSVVRGLEVGDAVAVWARARFPGWANHVQHVSIRVFWAI